MEVYYSSRSPTFIPPWNPTLEIYSETVLGEGLYTLPPVDGNETASRAAEELAEVLMVEHSLYQRYKKQWQDALNWFNGEEAILQYIHQHPRERKEHYERRLERGYYWNYTDSIIGLLASFVYSKTITRQMTEQSSGEAKTHTEELELFWKDIDRLGNTADEFFKTVFLYTQVYGLAYVMVDKPAVPEGIVLSEQHRQELGITPYCYYIPTLNLTNWRLQRDGTFAWARWFADIETTNSPFTSPGTETVRRYTTWDTGAWYVHDVITPKKGKEYAVFIDSGVNPLGRVPIARFIGKKDLSDPHFGKALAYTIGKINVAILNYLSLLDEDLYGKCLNLLAVQIDDVAPSENSNAPPQDPVTIGANNVLAYTSMSQPPFYLAPSSEPGDLLMRHIQACTDQIYRIALFGGAMKPVAPYSEKSGTAYAHEFNETNRMLSDKAYAMEKGEVVVCELWSRWLGLEKDGIGFIVDYPDEFHVEELTKELGDIMEAQKIVVSSTVFEKEMQKRVVRRLIDHDFRDLIEEINKEIDANALSPMEKQAQMMEQQQAMAATKENADSESSSQSDNESEEA